jgi:dienelactone hydrolase
MGIISDTVRTWPGAARSAHAIHPIAAVGSRAGELAGMRHETDFDFRSPYQRLIELNAWIVLLGVTYGSATMVHVIEERFEIPYRRWVTRSGTVVSGGVAAREEYRFLERYEGVENDFMPLGERLAARGMERVASIGTAVVRCVRTRDLVEECRAAVRADPLFLVNRESQPTAGTYLPRHGELIDAVGRSARAALEPEHPVSRRLADALAVSRPAAPGRADRGADWETGDGLVLEEVGVPGALRDKVPADTAPGLLAMPRERSGALPAVVCLHGTGECWQDLMERDLVARGTNHRGWARELARRGFAALAITQRGHPPRLDPWDWEWPKLLLPYGLSALGLLVSEVLSCVAFLESRPEVDPHRIAVVGYSLGGIVAFYSFAVDRRIAACVSFCGGVGSVRRLIRDGNTRFHSVYYYAPRLLAAGLDHPACGDALAPRPLLVSATRDDAGMPAAGVEEFESAARAAYGEKGAADRLRVIMRDGGHCLSREALEDAAAWLPTVL